MSIALKIGNENSQVQGFIYLDAVTRYEKDLSGKVTSFPVDSGVNISDHYIANNQKFSLEGVISNVDITGISDKIQIDGQKPINAVRKPIATAIAGQQSSLTFLPSAVKQFFERTNAAVVTDSEAQSTIPAVELLFEELMKGVYYNSADRRWRNKMTTTTLYEMSGSNFTNAKTDLVITNVSFSEDHDTGDSLKMNVSLEKVRFVTLEQVTVPKNVRNSTKKKVAGTENKGSPSTPKGVSNTDDENPGLYAINNPNSNPNAPKQSLGKYIQTSPNFGQILSNRPGP